jgi:hypothetical protein
MRQLVCTGTAYEFRGSDDPPAPDQSLPPVPQRPRLIKREFMTVVRPPVPRPQPRYQPDHLLNLASDQCRFSVADGIFCGAKVHAAGQSWCSTHRAVVFAGVNKAVE